MATTREMDDARPLDALAGVVTRSTTYVHPLDDMTRRALARHSTTRAMEKWDGLKRSFIESRERVSNALSDALARTTVESTSDASGASASGGFAWTSERAFHSFPHSNNPNGNGDDDDESTDDDDEDAGKTTTTRTSRGGFLRRLKEKKKRRSSAKGIDSSYYRGEDDAPTLSRGGGTTLATVTRGELAGSTTRAFVVMRVVGGDGKPRGRRVVTSCRAKTTTPVWNATRDLRCEATRMDALCVDVYAGESVKGVQKGTLIGRGQISLDFALAHAGVELAVPLYAQLERLTSPGTVYVKVSACAETRRTKRVFFVRHGESKWNEAQRDINIANMMRFDHPLTLVGVQQAQALGGRAAVACSQAEAGVLVHANVMSMSPPTMSPPSSPSACSPIRPASPEHPDHHCDGVELCAAFSACKTCYVSPLTRAVQTSCFMLQNHPRAMNGTMRQVCLQSIREIKGVGGLDTVGIAQGDGVLERAKKKLAEIVNEEAASRLGAGLMFDPNDAVGQWWTTETDSDSSKDVEARMYDFLETLRFDEDDAVIVVGHSLFLQQLVAKLVPPESESEGQGRATSQPIAIAPPNPFDTLTEMFSSNDPFATRPPVGAQRDIDFVPSIVPVAATIETRRDKGKIFEKLMNKKLCNAGCVAMDLSFDEVGRATLVDASLIFGSRFV